MKELKIIVNRLIPFKRYKLITLFDHIFVREENKDKITPIDKNHENTHATQVRDFGIGFYGYFIFYVLYILEWVLKLPTALFGYKPYRSVSWEQEAYINQWNLNYLKIRKRYAWVKYIFKLVK